MKKLLPAARPVRRIAISPVTPLVLPARMVLPRHPAWGEKIYGRTSGWAPGVLLDTWA